MFHKTRAFYSTGLILIIIKISSFNLWFLHVDLKKKPVYCLYYSSFSFSKEINEDYQKNIGIIDLCSSVNIITVSFCTIVLCIEITFHYFNIYITIKEL